MTKKPLQQEGLLLAFVPDMWYNADKKRMVFDMRIGTPAEAILPQYEMKRNVTVTSIDENDDAFCMCVGLSDDTFWFFGEDCIGELPLRIVISDVEYDGAAYTIYGKDIRFHLK